MARPQRNAEANPTYYGDSVAHWDKGTLVVNVTNFVDSTWFGEDGYFHSDAMHVTERLCGETAPISFTMKAWMIRRFSPPPGPCRRALVKPSTETLEESPKCVEKTTRHLTNNDHHGQR